MLGEKRVYPVLEFVPSAPGSAQVGRVALAWNLARLPDSFRSSLDSGVACVNKQSSTCHK